MHISPFFKFSRRVAGLTLVAALVAASFDLPAHADNPPLQNTTQEANSDAQKIDHFLALIDQRLSFASDVAKSKWNSSTVVDDPVREKQILDAISTKATAMGITNVALVEAFFQNQFEASKIIQTRLIMHWHTQYPANFKFQDAPDLAEDIRPKLDKLTPELIAALRDVQPLLDQPALRSYMLSKAKQLIRDDVNGEARRTALQNFEPE